MLGCASVLAVSQPQHACRPIVVRKPCALSLGRVGTSEQQCTDGIGSLKPVACPYMTCILCCLQFAAAVIYAAVKELLLQPKEYTCYNTTLDRIKDDPRVTVRLGERVTSNIMYCAFL
mgnify:CR=1 FL=1